MKAFLARDEAQPRFTHLFIKRPIFQEEKGKYISERDRFFKIDYPATKIQMPQHYGLRPGQCREDVEICIPKGEA